MRHFDLKRREMLPVGYVCFNGKVLNNYDVDTLNNVSEEINRFIDTGMGVDDEMLNRAHHAFCVAARVCR